MDNFSSYSFTYYDGRTLGTTPIWIIVAVNVVLTVVTVIGNFMVILAYITDEKIRENPAFTIILNLSITDFLVGIFMFPLNTIWWVNDAWVYGTIACKLWIVLDYSLFAMSTFIIVFISLDRYWLLSKGLAYRSFQTQRQVAVVLSVGWVAIVLLYTSITFLLPALGVNGDIEFDPESCQLEVNESKWFNISEIIVWFLVPFSALVLLNANVFRNIRERARGLVAKKYRGSSDKPEVQKKDAVTDQEISNASKKRDTTKQPDKSGVTVSSIVTIAEEREALASPPENVGDTSEMTVPGPAEKADDWTFVANGKSLETGDTTGTTVPGAGMNAANGPTHVANSEHSTAKQEWNGVVALISISGSLEGNGSAIGAAENSSSTKPISNNVETTTVTDQMQPPASIITAVRNTQPVRSSLNTKGGTRGKSGTGGQSQREKSHVCQKQEFKRHRKAAITLGVLVTIYCICFLPYFLCAIIASFCRNCSISYRAWEIVSNLVWCNAAIDPFIYGFTTPLFRKNFLRFMGIKRCKKH